MSKYLELFQYIGHALRYYRNIEGLRQEDVARKAGISRRLYQKLEYGTMKNVTVETLYLVCQVLNVEFFDIFPDLSDKNSIGLFPITGNEEFNKRIDYCLQLKNMIKLLEDVELPPNDLKNVHDVSTFLFSNYDFSSASKFYGIFWGDDNYPADEVIAGSNYKKGTPIGKYNNDRNKLAQIMYLASKSQQDIYFSTHLVEFDSNTYELAILQKSLGLFKSKNLSIYSGVNCSLHCENGGPAECPIYEGP
jgi:transcriptional regulator with XRE-family HTH domain